MISSKQAKYECLKCKHTWEDEPGPVECPLCGHLYVSWINYEELKKKRIINK